MIQSVAQEFQSAPIATVAAAIGILSGLIAVAVAMWTYLSQKRAPATPEVGLRGRDVETPPDFRVVLICLFVMPAIVTGLWVARRVGRSFGDTVCRGHPSVSVGGCIRDGYGPAERRDDRPLAPQHVFTRRRWLK